MHVHSKVVKLLDARLETQMYALSVGLSFWRQMTNENYLLFRHQQKYKAITNRNMKSDLVTLQGAQGIMHLTVEVPYNPKKGKTPNMVNEETPMA